MTLITLVVMLSLITLVVIQNVQANSSIYFILSTLRNGLKVI
jgi:hypothetical protein